MQLSKTFKESFTSVLEQWGLAWWVEVITDQPKCTYYFGPFLSANEADRAPRYIEDLKQESAQVITAKSKRCQPNELTIFEE